MTYDITQGDVIICDCIVMSDYVWLCIVTYCYVCLCGYQWLCVVIYGLCGYQWLCMVTCGYQ